MLLFIERTFLLIRRRRAQTRRMVKPDRCSLLLRLKFNSIAFPLLVCWQVYTIYTRTLALSYTLYTERPNLYTIYGVDVSPRTHQINFDLKPQFVIFYIHRPKFNASSMLKRNSRNALKHSSIYKRQLAYFLCARVTLLINFQYVIFHLLICSQFVLQVDALFLSVDCYN